MAITVVDLTNSFIPNKYPETGLTDDFVFRCKPNRKYKVEAIVTSAGSAKAIGSTKQDTPADISDFSADPVGLQSVNFQSTLQSGNEWVGVEIDSGTWEVIITELA